MLCSKFERFQKDNLWLDWLGKCLDHIDLKMVTYCILHVAGSQGLNMVNFAPRNTWKTRNTWKMFR